ncbi:beta-lactamase family protein [Aliifodinibius sp. S!AR15-10]|uniref:serine hydrolase domain-containing protein n=1 Tax=Aliifodinibius sp. S!AR15-10 TaxID=2950437 RepID=UPI0028559E69|nr:serine hydrolase [Aliifodinibius sp. S!AR15-10]MDR8393687.1 beta-lactamase family protein [Aliifodinibius sp. S!AR15-10]
MNSVIKYQVLIIAFGLLFFEISNSIAKIAENTAADKDSSRNETKEIRQAADDISSVRSLLIQKNGELLFEEYFDGQPASRAMNTKSASKSIISLLVGIAIDQGFIENKEQQIHQYFPEYFKEITDPQKRTITVEDLLTMRSGLETTSFHNYGRWVVSDDWVEFTLNQPMVDTPGDDMEYSTGSSHLLSVIIEKTSGMSTRAFAQKYLFDPMDIEAGGWQQDPHGYYFGGNNLALRPADMLKIGQMVLNGGTYGDQRIISKEWLSQSFQTYTRSNYNPYDYGYMWWNRMVAGRKVYFAWGFGGQYIFIIPELDSVVVITSSLQNANQSRSYKRPVFNLLRTSIIPYLEDIGRTEA